MKNSDTTGNRNLVLLLGQSGFTKDLPTTLLKDIPHISDIVDLGLVC